MYTFIFFFNDTATTEIYTLSLHDALPILDGRPCGDVPVLLPYRLAGRLAYSVSSHLHESSKWNGTDRKSTRLNSSHSQISYAVFCLKKKKKKTKNIILTNKT